MFAIFGLKNEGVDVSSFLSMDQGKAVKKIPVSFVNKKTGKILIDDLIQKIVRNKMRMMNLFGWRFSSCLGL